MADDNAQLSAAIGSGAILAGASLTFSGDTALFQICGGTILTGSEVAGWTQTLLVAGAGAVTGGVQRMTLANNDPAVALLTAIDVDTSKIPSLGTAAMAASAPVTLATDDTQFGAVGEAASVTGGVHAQLRSIADEAGNVNTNTAAIQTAVELLDNAIDGNYLNVNVNAAGTDLSMNAGVLTAQTQRVTIATNDEVNNLLGTIDADTTALFGCVAGTELQVDAVSVVPGTGATNLGKAIDSIVGATDTGIALLGKHSGDSVHLITADGDYDVLRVSDYGALHTSPEQHHTFDAMNAVGNWIVVDADTINVATTKKHVLGTDALSFDKDNTAANSVFAMIQNTISSVDLGSISPHDIIQTACYLPSLANVSYIFVRIGTDISNYNEWRVDVTDLTAATFEILALSAGDANYAGITGDGWNPSAITWIAVGVVFDAETITLAGIIFDELSFHTNQHTSATVNSEVSSSVNSSNVNVQKVGNKIVNTQAGNVGTGTQRVTIASDDALLFAIDADTSNIATNTVDLPNVIGTSGSAGPTKVLSIGGTNAGDLREIEVNSSGQLVIASVGTVGAGANLIGQTISTPSSDKSFEGTTERTVGEFMVIGTTAGGAGNELVAADATPLKTRLLSLSIVAITATLNTVYIVNDDYDLWANAAQPMPLSTDPTADSIMGWNSPIGWTRTTDTANQAIVAMQSTTAAILYTGTYIKVTA